MANIGRPSCQLQFESLGYPTESNPVINSYGYLVEDLLMFLIKASGLKVVSEQERVSITIEGKEINGVLDLILDLDDGYYTVWDIKSASNWAFNNKFNSWNDLVKEDTYGYPTQLGLYTAAKLLQAQENQSIKPFKIGGFLSFNKSTGEIAVVEYSGNQAETFKSTIEFCSKQIKELSRATRLHFRGFTVSTSKEAIKPVPLFRPIEEKFKKKPTGNKYLGKTCEFCPFKFHCWDNLQVKPITHSEGKNPGLRYYTHIENDNSKE